MTKRIKSIDIAKAIGIFLIVLGHVLKTGDFRKFLYSFHVPLFFFLSGLCFSRKNNKDFIINKLKKMYIPYIIISTISIIIYVILGKHISQGINSNFFDNIFGMIYANSNLEKYGMEWNRPLWFIPCLMALLIIINFFENLIKNIKHKNIIRSFIVIISFSIGIVLAKERIFLPFQIETSCNVMIFTYIGVIIKEIIKKNDESKLNLKKEPVIEFLFIIITTSLFIYLALNNTASIRENKIGNYFIYLIVGFGMILNTMILSFDIDRYFKRTNCLQYIGQNTMIILLLHKFPILFFQSVLPITKNLLNSSNKLFVVCFAIFISCLVICMCLMCDYIMKKMKKKKTAY